MSPKFAKLQWRCRRGTKELDALLQKFLTQRFEKLPPLQQERFEALLNLEDNELTHVLIEGLAPQQSDFQDLINLIRE